MDKYIYRGPTYAKLRTWYANLVKPKLVKPPYWHVVQIGDPVLRVESSKISLEQLKSNEIISVIEKLKFALKKYDCVGLSAPQIGIPLRIFIMEINKKHLKQYSSDEIKQKDMNLTPLTVFDLINDD